MLFVHRHPITYHLHSTLLSTQKWFTFHELRCRCCCNFHVEIQLFEMCQLFHFRSDRILASGQPAHSFEPSLDTCQHTMKTRIFYYITRNVARNIGSRLAYNVVSTWIFSCNGEGLSYTMFNARYYSVQPVARAKLELVHQADQSMSQTSTLNSNDRQKHALTMGDSSKDSQQWPKFWLSQVQSKEN